MDNETDDMPAYKFETFSDYAGYEVQTRANAGRNTHRFRVISLLVAGVLFVAFATPFSFWLFPSEEAKAGVSSFMHTDFVSIPLVIQFIGSMLFLGGLAERITFVLRYKK